jgi:hypothetical protein
VSGGKRGIDKGVTEKTLNILMAPFETVAFEWE